MAKVEKRSIEHKYKTATAPSKQLQKSYRDLTSASQHHFNDHQMSCHEAWVSKSNFVRQFAIEIHHVIRKLLTH